MTDAMRAETVLIRGAGGDDIEAYVARPVDAPVAGGVVVLHHNPGWDEGTKEITRRFATRCYAAVCPNLFYREAPGASPDDASAAARARGGVPDDRLVGDVAGAVDFLRSLHPGVKVATVGYCSGGRQAFLAACSLQLDAAVDCYGAFVVSAPPEGAPVHMRPIIDKAKDLSCPLLGLFGAEDRFPDPAEVAELGRVLGEHGKDFEFHTYEGAAHAFFAVDRPSYRPDAASEGWERIWEFFGRHLAR